MTRRERSCTSGGRQAREDTREGHTEGFICHIRCDRSEGKGKGGKWEKGFDWGWAINITGLPIGP